MIKSMTGYGNGEICTEQLKINIEMKSVNHRYCDIVFRMPRSLHALEDRMKRLVKKQVARGRVDVYIKLELLGQDQVVVKVNENIAASYLQAVDQIKDKFGLGGEITVTELLQLDSIISLVESDADVEQWWPALKEAATQALAGLLAMRMREGQQLAQDIKKRVLLITNLVTEIEERSPAVVVEHRERLALRMKEILDKGELDQDRLEAEVILFAERSSIAEEIVRLKSHLSQLTGCLENKTPVGRKLDFLLQEMNREINTIASKSADLLINHHVVEVKSELEKIREQVQNIE